VPNLCAVSPTTCTDTLEDCNEDEYCSVRGLEDFPTPIHFLSKKMKVRQEYVPSFRGNWTIVSRFQHRRGRRRTLLHLCEDNPEQSITLEIAVDPGDKLLSVAYSTRDSSLSKHRMNIPEFDKVYDINDLNCFALSYQAGYGNFKMFLNGVSDQLTDRNATFGQQGRVGERVCVCVCMRACMCVCVYVCLNQFLVLWCSFPLVLAGDENSVSGFWPKPVQ